MAARLRTTCLLFLLGFLPNLQAQDPNPCGTIEIVGPDSLAVCAGDTVTILLRLDVSIAGNLMVSPAADFLDAGPDPTRRLIRPSASGFYKISGRQPGICEVADSIYIDVDRLVVPELISDTTVCAGSEIELLADPIEDVGNSMYTLFEDGERIDGGRDPNFRIRVDTTRTYTLRANSENGTCEEEREVTIDVVPGLFDIPEDTLFACLGTDSLTLSVVDTPSTMGNIRWSPLRFTSGDGRGGTLRVQPTADITYYARATINGCERIDSVAVRLDSLPPDLSMTIDPERDPYCQGDTFFIRSPIYDAGDFPLITHEWTVSPGLQSPRELYNGVFIAQDTADLTRITRNGACVDTQMLLVNVIEPPMVTFSPTDPVCAGQEVQIEATFETGSGTLEWMDPNNTLSCTDCLDPRATVNATTEYMIELTTDGGDQCSDDLTYTLEVISRLEPILTDALQLCPGDSRQLIIGNVLAENTYRITGGGIDSDNPNVLVSPTQTTTYTVETTDSCGTFSQTIELLVLDDYSVELEGPSVICPGEALILRPRIEPPGIAGQFTIVEPRGFSFTGGTDLRIQDPVSGVYTLSFVDNANCGVATDSLQVTVLGDDINPIIQAALSDGTVIIPGNSIFAGNQVQLTVTNLPPDQNFTFEWSGNYEPMTASGQTITVNVPRVGDDDPSPEPLSYTVTLSSDAGDCDFTANITIPIEQSRVEAPDFFTPNQDGRNDEFRLYFNGQITDYTLIVYNRWGQDVFTATDPLEGWDGTKGGTPQNADMYLYIAKFRQDGAEVTQEGEFHLLR